MVSSLFAFDFGTDLAFIFFEGGGTFVDVVGCSHGGDRFHLDGLVEAEDDCERLMESTERVVGST